MIRPPRLRAGDVIRVVAPSGPVPREAFLSGVAVLRQRFDVRFGEGVFARDGFLAGPDQRRLEELRAALADPEAKAVMMARGGYGLLRLLPFLDPEDLRARPRPLIGFSDGTALLAFAARAGVAAVHGPVVTQFGNLGDSDQQALFRLLEDPHPGVLLSGMGCVIPGRAAGPLLGGNLEVFSRLLGTPFLPALDGAILFIEDLGERPYRIDRLLTTLDLAGVFNAVSAVVVGDFTGCDEPEATRVNSPTAQEVLLDRLGRLAIPVVIGAPVGHGTRNRALPYGTLCELDAFNGVLTAREAAVT
ncbi:MAG TPA: LD-carboxypeptidase [Polyangia bacterium]|nr:LD-carboxypeptidase [Polyangia bacterium]